MWVRLRNVNRVTAKGKVYYYHRRTGERLPEDSEARAKRVLELNKTDTADRSEPGTVAALIAHYKQSSDYLGLKESTRDDYARYLDLINLEFGPYPVSEADAEAIIEFREKFKDKPRTADYIASVLSKLLAFAVLRQRQFGLKHNPALKLGRLYNNKDGNKPWPPAALEKFRREARKDLRQAVNVGVYSGQRETDCLRMLLNAYDGQGVEVKARTKGAEDAYIPCHPDWKAELDEIRRERAQAKNPALTVVVGARGRPLTPDGFRANLRRELQRLGLKGLTFHGLRHLAAGNLAEVGCTDREIMAITGHKTLSMVQKYTRRANQRSLATAAITKLNRPK